ncbi:MAG: glycosyltransferase family 4 protein [Bacteroidales bacterium]|nr:glycosyltransferase family 4 protein [Bacteroidales bacterium]
MKKKIAQYLLLATLGMVVASYLPWVYLTVTYYILRYAIMACMAASFVLTFSLETYCSERFMRLFILTILIVAVEFVVFKLLGHRFRLADLSQLVVACLCIGIGMTLDYDLEQWANICYYYTLGLIVMCVINCFFWAGNLIVPEHYMLDEGKNQIGGMVAIAGSVMYFFTLKLPKQRTHFLVLFILTLLLLVLIRARSDCFALLACALFLSVKDIHWEWRPSLKNILTILGILLIAYIIYVGFISDELTRFMVGGKSSSDLDVLTSNRWERNQKGLEFLLKDPLLGEQEESSGILIIHNYILLRMVRYGIWSFPLVAFYLYFGIRTIVALFRERWTALRDVGFVACTIPLMVSFVEPNFPYGPGSVQMMAFLLLGATFRQYQQAPAHDAHGNTVLHISNDFTYSKVHTELYQHLDQEGVQQIVYTPIRNESLTGQNAFEGEHTRIIYSFILKPLHRLFFNRKIDNIGKDIAKQVDLDDVACVHATNLFSDGAAALWLKRHYGIPYIVAVRNSDLNAFLKYTPHLWWVHRAVIREAEKVVFITPMLQQRLTNNFTLIGMRSLLRDKSLVIPNGLNNYWLSALHPDPQQHGQNHSLIFVGNFDHNKNVLRLMDAVLQLKNDIPDIHLNLVGGTGECEQQVLDQVNVHSNTITYHGRIFDKDILQKLYKENSVFAMPSIHETFGLVYMEALSQGLSVLYTKNEGIDGLFEETVGESVNPNSTDSIREALRRLLTHPEDYQTLPEERFQTFQWTSIAQTYQNIYRQIIPNA